MGGPWWVEGIIRDTVLTEIEGITGRYCLAKLDSEDRNVNSTACTSFKLPLAFLKTKLTVLEMGV